MNRPITPPETEPARERPPAQPPLRQAHHRRPAHLRHPLDDVIAWATGCGADVPWSGVDAGHIAIAVRAPGRDGDLRVAADDYLVVNDAGVWSVYPADTFPHAHTAAAPA